MQYDKIKKLPVQFLGITGLEVNDFDFLLSHFKIEWDTYNNFFTLEGKLRKGSHIQEQIPYCLK